MSDLFNEFEENDLVNKDILKAIKDKSMSFTKADIRYIVDLYYQIQHFRTAAFNQESASKDNKEPTNFVEWLAKQMTRLEAQIKRAMNAWTETSRTSQWAKAQFGIGPILSAGLEAHLDITKAPVVANIWRFAGVDPTLQWLGAVKAKKLVDEFYEKKGNKKVEYADIIKIADGLGRRPDSIYHFTRKDRKGKERKLTQENLIKALSIRPYNAKLKILVWKIGESFARFSGEKHIHKCYYARLYRQRKEYLIKKNEAGDYAKLAETTLKEKKFKNKDYIKIYESGKLPDGRIDASARRYTAKYFLSHWHTVAYWDHHGKAPPLPYPIVHQGHAHYVPPPSLPDFVKQPKTGEAS
jgi:hypothetical protein